MSIFTNPASRSREQAQAYTDAVLQLLGPEEPLEVLRQTTPALEQVLAGLSASQLTQPEAPGKWSMRHVLQHLADSELVWGFRLRMVLAHERPALTGYDQDLWAARLQYDEADATQALSEFAMLRAANLRVLVTTTEQDRQRVGVHVERGEESLDHLIRLYAGHDLLHLRQLARIRDSVEACGRS